jgi:hypothetical protein
LAWAAGPSAGLRAPVGFVFFPTLGGRCSPGREALAVSLAHARLPSPWRWRLVCGPVLSWGLATLPGRGCRRSLRAGRLAVPRVRSPCRRGVPRVNGERPLTPRLPARSPPSSEMGNPAPSPMSNAPSPTASRTPACERDDRHHLHRPMTKKPLTKGCATAPTGVVNGAHAADEASFGSFQVVAKPPEPP